MHHSSARIVAIVLLSLISIGSAFGYSYVSSARADMNLNTPSDIPTVTPSPTPSPSPNPPIIDKNTYPIPANALSSPLFSLSQHVGGSKNDEVLEVLNAGKDIFLVGESDSDDKDICATKPSVFVTKITAYDLTKTASVLVHEKENSYYLGAKIVQDGVIILTTHSSGITIHKYSYNLVYMSSTILPTGILDSADTYLVEDDIYIVAGKTNGIYLIKIGINLDIKYSRLILSEGVLAGSLLSNNGFLVISNTSAGVYITSIAYNSNLISTSYISSAQGIDACPSLDTNTGAFTLLYTIDNTLRLRSIDTSLGCVYDTYVDAGSDGRVIPLSRGYLVSSYQSAESILVCKHGEVLKSRAGPKYDSNLIYTPQDKDVLLAGVYNNHVSIHHFTQDFEISYHITIPYATPIYIDNQWIVLNSDINATPYINGYGKMDGYILKYN